jgi:hypothetical protein
VRKCTERNKVTSVRETLDDGLNRRQIEMIIAIHANHISSSSTTHQTARSARKGLTDYAR